MTAAKSDLRQDLVRSLDEKLRERLRRIATTLRDVANGIDMAAKAERIDPADVQRISRTLGWLTADFDIVGLLSDAFRLRELRDEE